MTVDGAPVGEILKVTVDGEERSYHVKPNVFSDQTIQALHRMYKDVSRKHRAEQIKELSQLRGQIDSATFAELQTELIKSFVSKPFAGYMDAAELLQTRDGMAVALQMNCDEIKSSEEAYKVIESCSSVVDVYDVLFSSGNEAIEAAKNSNLPREEKSQSE